MDDAPKKASTLNDHRETLEDEGCKSLLTTAKAARTLAHLEETYQGLTKSEKQIRKGKQKVLTHFLAKDPSIRL